jgi:hypothetical protein
MAPRQFARKMKVGRTTFATVYRAVSEYRRRFPDKAVTYYGPSYPQLAWAVFMAEGSCAAIPVTDKSFLTAAAGMKMMDTGSAEYCEIGNSDTGFIIYSQSETPLKVALPNGKYRLKTVDTKSGKVASKAQSVRVKDGYTLPAAGVYWFAK